MVTRHELLNAYATTRGARPRIRVNFISSADGAVTLGGRAGGLGGPTDRRLMGVLRAMADVVLVGAGTVRVEGYGGLGLSSADLAWRREHQLPENPRLAIVSNLLDLEPASPVFSQAETRPLIVTNENAAPARHAAFAEVADLVICGDEAVDLHAMVNECAARGLFQILCEGGPHLFGYLLEDDLVDEVCLTLAPRFLAGTTNRIAISERELDRQFALVSTLHDEDGFVFLRYARLR